MPTLLCSPVCTFPTLEALPRVLAPLLGLCHSLCTLVSSTCYNEERSMPSQLKTDCKE
ncbi:hypothetical protein BD414DRAFT_488195 [Trametes punicea]|nr:hypothetical protein BD414DRAFT_488195 [Trametes punicea]